MSDALGWAVVVVQILTLIGLAYLLIINRKRR